MLDAVTHDGHGAGTRSYGELATGLNEAIAEARSSLSDHTELARGGLRDDLGVLLEEFARRRIRIAVYGEVKAGKSTLLNALAAAELSPVAFDPLTSIPVRITYGTPTRWFVGDQVLDNVADLARVMREGTITAGEVVIQTNLDLLQQGGQVDLLDTPGVGSEDRYDTISGDALRGLDAVVLVVRYPALFTRLTRHLMNQLEQDIGKLFVVWNIDADCAELTAEERNEHASTLRSRVAGAHELFLVDARAAFRAAQAADAAALAASGLPAFAGALGSFAASEKREVVALREVAKRVDPWLTEAARALTQEQNRLEGVLTSARNRLTQADAAATAKASAAQQAFTAFTEAARGVADERTASAAALVGRLGKQIRAERRRWIRTADVPALDTRLGEALHAYADAISANDRSALDRLRAHAKEFGSTIDSGVRARTEPTAAPLAPDERIERSQTGHFALLRRALWRRWYLPGVDQLERSALPDDLAAQAQWFDGVVRAATDNARVTLEARLGRFAKDKDAEQAAIKRETSFDAAEAKVAALRRDTPTLERRAAEVRQISAAARGLLG